MESCFTIIKLESGLDINHKVVVDKNTFPTTYCTPQSDQRVILYGFLNNQRLCCHLCTAQTAPFCINLLLKHMNQLSR